MLKLGNNEKGSMVLEFFGVIFFLVLLAFLIAQFALIAQAKIVVEAAARDAARVAAVDPDPMVAVTAAANAATGFPRPLTTISDNGDTVTANVEITVPVIKMTLLKKFQITVSANAVMPKEKPLLPPLPTP